MTRHVNVLMLATAGLTLAAPAHAHVVFADPLASAGGYYAGFLRISHGCGDAATTQVRVEVPDGVLTARPQPKPGWTLAIERQPLPSPVPGERGATINRRVSAIVWTGRLPADQFDQFGIMMKLPEASGPLYFPTVQSCETGQNAWTQIPDSPAGWHALSSPAPMLQLSNPDDGDHHGH